MSRAWPLASLLTVAGLCAVHGNFAFGFPVMAYLTGRRMTGGRAVKAYVSAILNRLQVRNRVQAAIVAYEAGLVGDDRT